jgi:hypothetical protein
VPTVNSRKTIKDFEDVHEATAQAIGMVARDTSDGFVISSVTIIRHEHRNVRGVYVVRYFVEVNSHD